MGFCEAMPDHRQLCGRIFSKAVLASALVGGSGTRQESVDIQPLQRSGEQTNGGSLARPSTNPVPHGKATYPTPFFGHAIQFAVDASHSNGMFAEFEIGRFIRS